MSKASGHVSRFLAVGLILGMLGFAAMAFFSMRADLSALKRLSQDNLLWSAMQLEVELLRFSKSVSDFVAGHPQVGPGDVNDRFDILWSRVAGMGQGKVGTALAAYDADIGLIGGVESALYAHEEVILALGPQAAPALLEVAQEFEAHRASARFLSMAVLQGQETQRAALEQSLSASAQQSAILSLGTVVLSVLWMVYSTVETRKIRRLADANLKLARHAERAAKVKSQFLTMMSHELRTPMNGVLGLLALVRQSGLPNAQANLVDRAERSGRLMIGILADILDFSALQDDSLELEIAPFSPAILMQEVQDHFKQVALREGAALTLEPELPQEFRVWGDARRLRQALTHLATYLVDTAGTRSLGLSLQHQEGCLIAKLTFTYGAGGADWSPELILGAPDRSEDQFASDALGPAVARGLVERMGGRILLTQEGPAIAIILRVPAADVDRDKACVKVVSHSAALRILVESAFSGLEVVFDTPGLPRKVEAIMVEGALPDLGASLPQLRAEHPHAQIVVMGSAPEGLEPDLIAPLPLDRKWLQFHLGLKQSPKTAPPQLRLA